MPLGALIQKDLFILESGKKAEDGMPISPILEVKLPRTFGLQAGIRAAAFIIQPIHDGKKCFLKKNATSPHGEER